MAADVDKNGSEIPPRTARQNPGSGSWLSKGLWTLLVVGAVPLLAFGVKNYRDAHLLKRHVSRISNSDTLAVLLICWCFILMEINVRGD